MIVVTKLGLPGGPQKLTHDTADTVKVFQSFPYVAPDSPDRVEVPLPQKAGQEPGTVEFLDPFDQTLREGKIYYTDYETCAILDFEVYGHQCALWVRRDVVKSLSKECIDQFEDTCGVVVPENRRIHCGDEGIKK
ncbi:hypothetical protein MRX96_048680 [Rhipicephalus microplus]